METPDLTLKTLIRAVNQELWEARAERLSDGRKAIFQVEELTLEVSFVVTESSEGGGGIDFKIVKADGKVKYDDQSVQKIVLKLKAIPSDDAILTDLGEELPLQLRQRPD